MKPSFKPEKIWIFTTSFVYGVLAALTFGTLAAFVFWGYRLYVMAGALLSVGLSGTEAQAMNIVDLAEKQLQEVNFMMVGVLLGSVVIGLAVWMMDAVDQRLQWRREHPRARAAIKNVSSLNAGTRRTMRSPSS